MSLITPSTSMGWQRSAIEAKSPLFCRHNRCSGKVPRGLRFSPDEARCGAEVQLFKFVAAILFIGIIAGGTFLATWDIPAPTEQVEKTIPNDRFPR